jgi:hypothetical protein
MNFVNVLIAISSSAYRSAIILVDKGGALQGCSAYTPRAGAGAGLSPVSAGGRFCRLSLCFLCRLVQGSALALPGSFSVFAAKVTLR